MSAEHDSRLVTAAMALRGAAPREWDHFIAVIREYAAAQVAEMLRATPDMLFKAQGMALGVQEVSQMLNEAPTLFEKSRERRMTGGRSG